MSNIYVDIVKTPLSVEKALTFVDDPSCGASTVFIGKVRDYNEGKTVAETQALFNANTPEEWLQLSYYSN